MRYVIVTWRKNIHHTYLCTPYWSLLHTVKNSCLYFLRWTWLGDLFSCISWLKFFYLWFLIEYGKIFSCPRELFFFFYAWAAPNEEFKCNVTILFFSVSHQPSSPFLHLPQTYRSNTTRVARVRKKNDWGRGMPWL